MFFNISQLLGLVSADSAPALDSPTVRNHGGLPLPLIPVSAILSSQRHASDNLLSAVNLYERDKFTYLVPIVLGGQEFNVTFDTGSADLWIASTECKNVDCSHIKKYSNNQQSDQLFNISYVTGWASGTVEYGNVSLGVFEVTNQVFGSVTETDNIGLAVYRNSGIMGLAFPRAGNMFRYSAHILLENLMGSLTEENRFFAFKLGADRGQSSLMIGQVDPDMMTSTYFSYFPVSPATPQERSTYDYWKLPLNSITINGLVFPLLPSRFKGSKTQIAVFDSGTTVIIGPSKDVANFWNAVGGAYYDESRHAWKVLCNRLADVAFVFGGIDGAVHTKNGVWAASKTANSYESLGTLPVVHTDQGKVQPVSCDWLLGDIFLRNVYVTHHVATASRPPFIGLANHTDPEDAMLRFIEERGPDTTPFNPSFNVKRTYVGMKLMLLVSTISSFFFGILAGVLFSLCTSNREWRRFLHRRFRGSNL